MQEITTDRTPDPARAGDTVPALLHQHIVRARVLSAGMVELQRAERIGFHSASLGHEGAIVGAVLAAQPSDWVFPGARDWYAAIARGLPLQAYMHHAFGSAEDPACGHSAPDHPPARTFRVVPPSGVVGAHLPQAVGVAWAAKIARDESRACALALFGGEVVDTGDFHNAMNFAGVFKAPVVFVCRATTKDAGIAGRAVAYGLASAVCDGADAAEVHEVVAAALARARDGRGATLIEVLPASPARLTPDANVDLGDAILDLGAGDPLVRARAALGQAFDAAAESAFVDDLRAEIDAAAAAAERAGPPPRSSMFDHVYAAMPPHLALAQQKAHG